MSSTAIKRITREYGALAKDPEPGFHARPLESNRLHCHFILHGSVFFDTPYEGGVYHGVLQFPRNYPLSPPSVIMRTETGRFKVNAKICFSMSDFHPELWNPMWSVKSILTGLISFFNSEEITTGGVRASHAQRVAIAKSSLSSVSNDDKIARDVFDDILNDMVEERGDVGSTWPPERNEESKPKKKESEDVASVDEDTSPAPVATPEPTTKVSTDPTPELSSRERRRLRREKAAAAASETSVSSDDPPDPPTPLPKSDSSKASDKNRKKKERQKLKKQRQKFASDFLSNLRSSVPSFLSNLTSVLLSDHSIDVLSYPCDHVCFRTSTQAEYDQLTSSFNATPELFELLVEGEIGGRMISTFAIVEGVETGDGRTVDTLEVPAPKEGSYYETGLEHAEFVIPSVCDTPSSEEFDHRGVLEDFAKTKPELGWSFKATGKECNPDVSLKVDLKDAGFGVSTVKFHLLPLPAVIEWEKRAGCGGGWETKLAEDVVKELEGYKEDGKPYVVAMAGGPGSGKSTAAKVLSRKFEASMEGGAVLTLPMDGYHKPLKDLSSKEEIYRRGCPSTFDLEALKHDLGRMVSGSEIVVDFPGWDHSVGDPVQNAHRFERGKHRVVIIEGLYLLLPSWGLKGMFDKTVFVRSNVDKCMEMLKVRNACIPGYTKEEIELRVDEVDRDNARVVGEEGGGNEADLAVNGYSCVV